jgi:predicted RNase H-like HicB family nuclease
MKNEYTAVIKQDGKWWLGWIEEVPGVNCQESSYDELLESLRVTLLEALDFSKQEALASAGADYREEKFCIDLNIPPST